MIINIVIVVDLGKGICLLLLAVVINKLHGARFTNKTEENPNQNSHDGTRSQSEPERATSVALVADGAAHLVYSGIAFVRVFVGGFLHHGLIVIAQFTAFQQVLDKAAQTIDIATLIGLGSVEHLGSHIILIALIELALFLHVEERGAVTEQQRRVLAFAHKDSLR